MDRVNVSLIVFTLLLLPLVKTSVIDRAVHRFRNDVNRVNPVFRLVTNIYQGNYKFLKTRRKRRNPNTKKHGRERRKNNRLKKASSTRLNQKQKTRGALKHKNTVEPTNDLDMIKLHNPSKDHMNIKNDRDETMKTLVSEMKNMILQILINQNNDILSKSVRQNVNNEDLVQHVMPERHKRLDNILDEGKVDLDRNISDTDFKSQSVQVKAHWNPITQDLPPKDPFVAKIEELIATIERIKKNPVYHEHKQHFYLS